MEIQIDCDRLNTPAALCLAWYHLQKPYLACDKVGVTRLVSQITDRSESRLRSQLFCLGVMQLLLLKKERNAACPWSIYSTIPTQLSPRFWKYLRFPATCRFCCTSMSHCFCKAFMPVPPPCFKVASLFLHVDRFLPNDECMQVRSSTKT